MGGPKPRPILVQKYGGSSLATPEALQAVARRLVARQRQGHSLVVVVSAMGRTTESLLGQGRAMAPQPPRRELDMLVTAGERICMALLCIAIDAAGAQAISLTGSQSGIITDNEHQNARIVAVNPWRIRQALDRGQITIVAGYQGVSRDGEVTTLGRGGSDTTAVALAAALGAEACEIYSDVDGVFTADPKLVPQARLLTEIDYETMQTLSQLGAKVLNAQAVAFAKRAGITIVARHATCKPMAQSRIGKTAGQAFDGAYGQAVAVASLAAVCRLDGAWCGQAERLYASLAALSARVLATESHSLWLDCTHMVDASGQSFEALTAELCLQRRHLSWASLIGDASLSVVTPQAMAALQGGGIEVQAIITHPQALSFAVAPQALLGAVHVLHGWL